MSMLPSLPSYTDVVNILQKSGTNDSASQVHGLMCGLICATSGKVDNRWETILFGNSKKQNNLEVLLELYETSYHQMSEFSFEFTLLLPDDQADINQRAEALGLWCQGFLTGLEHGKVPIKNRPPGEVTEALDDMIEISQVNYGEIATNEEDETAYYELVEYVRLATLMIYHELKSDSPSNNSNENNALH